MTLRLHVEVHGSGEPLVLAHGFGGSARNFRPQVRGLRSGHRLVLFDLRGHARSEAPDDPDAYTLAALASDCSMAMRSGGVARAVVGGLSLGAVAALEFALTRPERLRGLVLASFPASADSGHGFGAIATRFAAAIDARGLEAAGAEFVWGPRSGLDRRAAALVRQGFLEHSPAALAHTLRGVIDRLPTLEEWAPRLAGLSLPTCIVSGGADAGSLAAARRLAEVIPHSRHAIIPQAGHVVNLERPKEFNRIIKEFLEELPKSESLE
jgi:pimeloyl-ACP methyl ester carboxylesterase